MSSLTSNQVIFLKMVKSGTATRSISNKTARVLKREGYLNYSAMVGWWLTDKGIQALEG